MVNKNVSSKSRLVDALLCWFLGAIGAHKFYEGKIGMGILYIFTFGLFGIGAIVDFIMILCGSAVDSEGLPIVTWLDDQGGSSNANAQPAADFVPAEDEEARKVRVLKEYKDMLDKGVITQEEFDRKKDDLLK